MKDEALRLALEALTEFLDDYQSEDGMGSMKHYAKKHHDAITAIKQALEQPGPEPVSGVVIREGLPTLLQDQNIKPTDQRLYAAPPKRKWQGLTADELNMIGDSMRTWNSHSLTDVYVAIEAKLKEKNDVS